MEHADDTAQAVVTAPVGVNCSLAEAAMPFIFFIFFFKLEEDGRPGNSGSSYHRLNNSRFFPSDGGMMIVARTCSGTNNHHHTFAPTNLPFREQDRHAYAPSAVPQGPHWNCRRRKLCQFSRA